ncbi:MAG: PA0069 family radical SAM protein [Phycisphaerales bacterium JB039]
MGERSTTPAAPPALARGRASQSNPANRFEKLSLEVLAEHVDEILAEAPDGRQVRTLVFADRSRTVINRVDSPDIGFKWTINPYRGCEHGCAYCYARPGHETLGFSCGLDFETKIVAKLEAPALLRRELARPRWKRETIVMSGVTDPYQPVERKLELTRRILEVLREARQPVSVITKSSLILRDLDILGAMAADGLARAAVSITSLDNRLSSAMEPRASSPRERLRAVRELAAAGVPVNLMTAPIIPGLNDREIPALLEAAAEAGATGAGYILLRLPHGVKDVFLEWLGREFPDRAGRVESLIRQCRGGGLYDPSFGVRQRGEGPVAEMIARMFEVGARRAGLDRPTPEERHRVAARPAQTTLFDV